MGRGSSGMRGAPRVVLKSGSELPGTGVVEFDGELAYGAKDPSLSEASRKQIESWENKRRKAKVEYAYSVDENGNEIYHEVKGGKTSVTTPSVMAKEGATFTHIHPRKDGSGYLGGTFSTDDIGTFTRRPVKTMRAAAKEGTYSISKGDGFDSAGFTAYARQADANFRARRNADISALSKQIKAGKITWDEYAAQNTKGFNSALVALHNEYIAGQKKYGYTYTLEQV